MPGTGLLFWGSLQSSGVATHSGASTSHRPRAVPAPSPLCMSPTPPSWDSPIWVSPNCPPLPPTLPGVQHRDGAFGDDATHNDGFPEGTGAGLAQWDQDPWGESDRGHLEFRLRHYSSSPPTQNIVSSQVRLVAFTCRSSSPSLSAASRVPTFKPGSGLKQGLLESHIEVEIQSFVLGDVVSYPGEQDKVVEALSHAFLEVRGENPSFFLGGVGVGKRDMGEDPRSLDSVALAL